jgi:hypothetical protein
MSPRIGCSSLPIGEREAGFIGGFGIFVPCFGQAVVQGLAFRVPSAGAGCPWRLIFSDQKEFCRRARESALRIEGTWGSIPADAGRLRVVRHDDRGGGAGGHSGVPRYLPSVCAEILPHRVSLCGRSSRSLFPFSRNPECLRGGPRHSGHPGSPTGRATPPPRPGARRSARTSKGSAPNLQSNRRRPAGCCGPVPLERPAPPAVAIWVCSEAA